jgi:hypothetical protein
MVVSLAAHRHAGDPPRLAPAVAGSVLAMT